MEENREQEVISERQRWCGYREKKKVKVACPIEEKVQQSSTWSEELESIVKEKEKERDVRRISKILREVWLDIGIEKVDIHEDVVMPQTYFLQKYNRRGSHTSVFHF